MCVRLRCSSIFTTRTDKSIKTITFLNNRLRRAGRVAARQDRQSEVKATLTKRRFSNGSAATILPLHQTRIQG